jgi:hypothetical protein
MAVASDLGDNCSHVQIVVIKSYRYSLFLVWFIHIREHFCLCDV